MYMPFVRVVFFVIIIVSSASFSPQAFAQPVEPLNPVIFLPGILGSKLSEGNTVIWGDVMKTVQNFEKLELPLDPAMTKLQPSGILDDLQVFGPFRAGIYTTLLKTLADLGFKENEKLFIFSYDWRLSTIDNAERLRDFIELVRKKYSIPPNQRFNIVAHSMGGMIARIFILNYGGQKDVERLITIATPHFGSLNAFHALMYGMGGLENWVLGGVKTVQRVAFSFPSLFELLATYPTCCVLGDPMDPGRQTFSLLDFARWKRYGWIPPEILDSPERYAFLERTFRNANQVKQLMIETELPGVLQIKIAGDLIDTRWRAYFDPANGRPIKWLSSGGDGTVVLESATAGNWLLAQAVSAQHATIFGDPRVGSNLKFALTKLVQQFSAQVPDEWVQVANERVRLKSAGIQTDRQYYQVGSQGEVLLTLMDINDKPISGASPEGSILMGDKVQQSIQFTFSSASPPGYRGVFTIPQAVGTYRILIKVPGMTVTPQEVFVALQEPKIVK